MIAALPRTWLTLAAVAFAAGSLVVLGVGEWLSRPARSVVGQAPASLAARSITVTTAGGGQVAGWFAPGQAGKGAVLLLHGVRADRRQMIGRARMLQAAGHGVLLIDLPAHGESSGARITFGLREADGVRAALSFLRQTLPGERIGVIGVSLGAAALVLARPDPPPAAVVLEAMYPSITQALENRLALRLGRLGRHLAPLLLWQMPLRLGIAADQLRPVDDLAQLVAPTIIMSGLLDRKTTPDDSRRMHAAAPGLKTLWLVEGATHQDLYAFDPAGYRDQVLPFLARQLDATSPGQQAPTPAVTAPRVE